MAPEVSHANYAALFKEKITELQGEPAFERTTQPIQYAVDKKGIPLIKVAVGNVPLTYDLWKGLRNPAVIGLYPAGLREIWEFYAHRRPDHSIKVCEEREKVIARKEIRCWLAFLVKTRCLYTGKYVKGNDLTVGIRIRGLKLYKNVNYHYLVPRVKT